MTAPPIPKKLPKKPPGIFKKLFGAIVWLITWPARLSAVGRATFALALFLVTFVVVASIMFRVDPEHVPWRHYMTLQRQLIAVGLVIFIPIVFYRALRLWLEGERSQFPDLDYAWEAGIEALEQHGISLESTPLFLVVGSHGEDQENAIMEAAGMPIRVEQTPQGPAQLHWYATTEGVYLFCTETSWLTSLATEKNKKQPLPQSPAPQIVPAPMPVQAPPPAPSVAADPPPAQSPVAVPSVARSMPTPQPASGPPPSAVRGTMTFDQFSEQAAASPQLPATPAPPTPALPVPIPGLPKKEGGTASFRGTLMLQSDQPEVPAAATPAPAPAAPAQDPLSEVLPPALPTDDTPASVPPHESTASVRRLQYLCQLLQSKRQPLCPINGIMVLIPFSLVQGRPRELDELERAVRGDLTTIHQTLGMRCPVSVIVVGMERERGFGELVRRVGPERATTQRFGGRYDLRTPATTEGLTALSAHVCGAFEDWVYTLFREKQGLTRPGNTHLYSLLCKVRCHLKTRLSDVLVRAFAYDTDRADNDEPLLFSGCYFAATGQDRSQQAFVRGVFEKLIAEQEEVEWLPNMLSRDRWIQALSYVGVAVNVVLLSSLCLGIWWLVKG